MKYIFINRDCDTERLSEFTHCNGHIKELERFSAIDGKSLNIEDLIAADVIERDTFYTKGAIGSAMSHVTLWMAAAEKGTPVCIIEDDAILCANFVAESDRIIKKLESEQNNNWDIILWGHNYDTSAAFNIGHDRGPAVAFFSQADIVKNSTSFSNLTVTSHAFKLIQTLGICGYTVSPQGAQKLLRRCIPIKKETFYHKQLGKTLPGTSIDHVMSHHYAELDAFVCLPPLCITKNDHATSTNING